MKHDKTLSDIIKKKSFKNFWYCFEFLIFAGYSQKEALEISVDEFGEGSVYSNVAFVRMVKPKYAMYSPNPSTYPSRFKIGFIDETTIKLSDMYTTYRKWLMTDKLATPYSEIEDMCNGLLFRNLTLETLTYLLSLSKKHFGFEAFKILPPEIALIPLDAQVPQLIINMEEIRQQMTDIVRIPSHFFGKK